MSVELQAKIPSGLDDLATVSTELSLLLTRILATSPGVIEIAAASKLVTVNMKSGRAEQGHAALYNSRAGSM